MVNRHPVNFCTFTTCDFCRDEHQIDTASTILLNALIPTIAANWPPTSATQKLPGCRYTASRFANSPAMQCAAHDRWDFDIRSEELCQSIKRNAAESMAPTVLARTAVVSTTATEHTNANDECDSEG